MIPIEQKKITNPWVFNNRYRKSRILPFSMIAKRILDLRFNTVY